MKIFVTIKTGAKEDKVEKIDETHYKVDVKEYPIKGKANKAICKLMARFLHIPQSYIELRSGISSKQKVFTVSD